MKKSYLLTFTAILLFSIFLFPLVIRAQESGGETVSFEGTGVVVERNNGRIVVTGIFKGSPAEGRLMLNDQILDIYGESTKLMTVSEVLSRIERPAGIPLKLIVLRDKRQVTVDLTTASYPVTPKTIPDTGDVKYSAKILGFQSRDFMDVRFFGTRLKYGDTFFVFDKDYLLALARVRNVSGDSASMKVIRLYREMKNHESYRYNLAFYCYLPEVFKIEPLATPTPTNTENSRLRVRINGYELNQTPDNKIRALVTFENIGNVTASKIFADCILSDRGGKVHSRCTETVESLKPESKYVMELFLKFNPGPGQTVETNGRQIFIKAAPGSDAAPVNLSFKIEVKSYSEDGDIYIFRENF